MKVDFDELKVFHQDQDRPNPGCLATLDQNLDWLRCREQFHRRFRREEGGFYFSHEADMGENIAHFIARTEEIISFAIPNIPRTRFSFTNKNFALWIAPSKFWLDCPVRTSLLTIIARAGMAFDKEKNNYDEALYSPSKLHTNYVLETRFAINRFLYGFTTYVPKSDDNTNTHSGWVTLFRGKTKQQIVKQLIRTNDLWNDPCLVGSDSLWA